MTLDFVFGYRGSDSRQNLCYTPSGEVLFHAAGAGIVYNQQTNTQSFFLEHSDDIIALALNRCERFSSVVATGQIGKTAPVFVWDYISKETLSILHGAHEVGVCSVDFSCNGKLLLTVGLGPSHSVAVWKWQEGVCVHTYMCSRLYLLVFVYSTHACMLIVYFICLLVDVLLLLS